MRAISVIIFFCIIPIGNSYGQAFTYPTIKAEGKSVKDFIPDKWIILDSAKGDLNGDNIPDIVFVLQYKDSVSISEEMRNFIDTVITQPRLLVILFFDKARHTYTLAKQSTFVLNHDRSFFSWNPVCRIGISNKTLEIDFFQDGNGGGTNSYYTFRYENKLWDLIAAKVFSFSKNENHDSEQFDFNFLTKKWSYTTENDDPHSKKVEWHALDIKELKNLNTLKQPGTWEVVKGDTYDIYL